MVEQPAIRKVSCFIWTIISVVERFVKATITTIEINNCMYKCNHCNKEFDSVRKLNGHKGIHRDGGRYSVSRKKNTEIHACKQCGKEFSHRHSSFNIYCSSQCKADWEYKNISLPKLHSGQVSSTSTVVGRYLRETFGRKCSICGLEHWMDSPVPLDVDHIDGNPLNNLPDNLRLVCPNCHRLTETWGNKAKKRELKNNGIHGRRTLGL